jgi:Leucine-rich repeat (LRR) protein
VLDLSSNSLASLPKALLSLKKLTTLRLQGNTELVTSGLLKPETLASGDIAQVAWHLRHQLQIELDHGGQRAPLSESQVVGVGNEAWSTNHHVHRAFTQAIALAQQSHTLDFHWKHLGIAQFPPTFFTTLRALRELRLSGQDLDVLPSAFATVCGSLRVLQLRKNNLRRMEDDVFDCDSLEPLPLEELDLECNGLESLPRSMGRLTSLRVLRVSNNKLTHDGLPETFANLTSLAELYMTHNRLMQPSATFSSLVSLEKLDMSYNQLTTLETTAFAPLQRLRQLRVSVNALTDLPDDLALAPIEELLIAGNRLESLPATVLLLKTSLRVLRMQSNKISRLPLAFGDLEALEVVEADGNPFRSPPPEIMNSSIRLIRAYLRKRHERVHEMQRLLQTLRIPYDDSVFADPTLMRLLVRENGPHNSKALAFLTEKHLVAFERAVDAYVNGAFYLSPSTLRGADLVTELLLQKQFFLAQQHRAHVLRDLVRLCALVRNKKWLDKVDFRFDLRRPWGRLGEDCSVYALNPRALYDDSPELPSVLSVIRKRVHHGFESEAFDHAEETVRDAIENYLGVYGPVGVCHDDVPFKCGCEELLRFNKKHEPCFRDGWSFVQVVYTPEEAERRVRDEETIQKALEALRPQVETFLLTAEGEKRFHKEVQVLKNALRKGLKAKKKRLKLLRAKHTKMKRVRDKEKQREAKAAKLQATEKILTVGEVAERAEQEEKFKTLSERLDEATKEYQKGKTQLGQGYGAFLGDVVTLLLEKIGSEVRNHLVQQQRQKAIQLGLRRPWDGPNGRDFEAYKHLVRRRMLGDGSMEREDAGVADGGGGGLAEGGEKADDDRGSDNNSEISDVSFAGYDDLVSNLQAPDAGVDDDGEDDDDEEEEEDDTVEARAEALAKLEVSDVSDTEDREGSAHRNLESEDSDL